MKLIIDWINILTIFNDFHQSDYSEKIHVEAEISHKTNIKIDTEWDIWGKTGWDKKEKANEDNAWAFPGWCLCTGISFSMDCVFHYFTEYSGPHCSEKNIPAGKSIEKNSSSDKNLVWRR